MERLTEKVNELDIWKYKLKLQKNFRLDEYNGELTLYGEAVNRLADYEDAEENGLLVRLPCKIGDCLYSIALGKVAKHKVYGCRYNGNDVFLLWVPGEFRVDGTPAKSIGKTVFLTQEEADAKLKEMEGENADSD